MSLIRVLMVIALLSIQICHAEQLERNDKLHFVFEHKDNFLTLRTSRVPLERVLKQFCKETYVCPVVKGDLTEKVSFLFDKLPIEQALKRIANGRSFVIIYTAIDKNDLLASERQIKEFRIYGKAKDLSEPISSEVRDKLEKIRLIDALADVDAIPELAKMLMDEKDAKVKIDLIETLTLRNDEQVIRILSPLLGDKDDQVLVAVIQALGYFRNVESSLLLAQILFSSSDPQLRKIVLEELSTFSILPAKHFLNEATKDKDEKVQQKAETALESWKFSVSEE